ncbi:hypothetical protein J3D55_002779 [Chryseobacterium ginsenosidimutans]|uniref:hypothetical protein n=1 Tax=Chryseobacterium ginsenosidimutans TaxID=687846 RepID=UPI002166C504|nr:hypothetical protein [Chryseobacterium ginsenosidimutans]MCS3869863.1 hypothetical protein [Chryseobacterium ginsenosidimutans]
MKTAILETELVKVPMVKEKGTTELGRIKFKIGINSKLAPPPQIALIQNAIMVSDEKKNDVESHK